MCGSHKRPKRVHLSLLRSRCDKKRRLQNMVMSDNFANRKAYPLHVSTVHCCSKIPNNSVRPTCVCMHKTMLRFPNGDGARPIRVTHTTRVWKASDSHPVAHTFYCCSCCCLLRICCRQSGTPDYHIQRPQCLCFWCALTPRVHVSSNFHTRMLERTMRVLRYTTLSAAATAAVDPAAHALKLYHFRYDIMSSARL